MAVYPIAALRHRTTLEMAKDKKKGGLNKKIENSNVAEFRRQLTRFFSGRLS